MPPVEIQWCDHSSVLLEYFRQLYEEGRFVDVGLECESRQVKAHKAVISACSPYLEGLLKGNPARSHLIKFNGYSYSSLQAVIDFMYNGTVLIEQEHLAAFLKLGRALQVRGILDIANQCEEAGLTTAEETKSNAQYSTTVQQSQKTQQNTAVSTPAKQISQAENRKYAFMMEKPQPTQQSPKKPVTQQTVMHKPETPIKSQPPTSQPQLIHQQEQLQQQQEQQQTQQTERQVAEGNAVDQSTLEELQQALASGQALLQADGSTGEDQTLQMVEGQYVVTGSGQTYVVVQDGDNINFVPAEMVQGVNGGQVMEELDPVDQQLAQMEGVEGGVVSTTDASEANNGGTATSNAQEQLVTSSEGSSAQTEVPVATGDGSTTTSGGGENMETMSVVESLVKLGEKQPGDESSVDGVAATEVGADMPSLDTTKDDEGGEKRAVEEDPSDDAHAENVSKHAKLS